MRVMNAIIVEENEDGSIEISQPSSFTASGMESVIITKEQAPIVVKWIEDLING